MTFDNAIPKMTQKDVDAYARGLKKTLKGATTNPNGLRYRIKVNCTEGNCPEVRKYMKSQGFTVKKEQSIFGDHYGIKRFKTPKQAIAATDALYKKYNKSLDVPKIEDANMLPIIPVNPELDFDN